MAKAMSLASTPGEGWLATLLGNLLADLSYAWIDPRVSLTEQTA